MNEEMAVIKWMDYLAGELAEEDITELKDYLGKHPELQHELHAEQVFWDQLQEFPTPAPSDQMDMRFDAMLKGYLAANEKQTNPRWRVLIENWLMSNWQVGLASLCIGLVIGWIAFPKEEGSNGELANLSQEVSDMKKVMMLTLIEQPKAQERIRAVSMTDEFSLADDKVIEVLGNTLNTDPNVNVRLAALESLMDYWETPQVRALLVNSIANQTSPHMQVAMADAMLEKGEKNAVEQMSKLLDNPMLDMSVKEKIELTIKDLRAI
ncbi:MAG: HEAT repeat domain-containing protein [Cyclobacteriaceae bacterium]